MATVGSGKATHAGKTLAEWVPTIVASLVQSFDPLQVILFGSVARGDDSPDSDIDLLVVLPAVDYSQRRQLMADMRRAIDAPIAVNVYPTDPRECERRHDVIAPCTTGRSARGRSCMSKLPDNTRDEAGRPLTAELPPEYAPQDQKEPVTCVLCKNGQLVPGTADKALAQAGVTLVVQGIPAEICDNCGERYFDEQVTRRLLYLAREAAAAGVVVGVRRYVAA